MSETNQKSKKSPVGKILRPLILIAVLAIAGWYGYGKYQDSQLYEVTDNASVEATSAPVLSRTAGYVKMVTVKDYEEVQDGKLLVTVDSADIVATLHVLEADLANAQADLLNAKANLQNAEVSTSLPKSNIKIIQTRIEKARRDYERDQKLFNEHAITAKQLDDTKATLDVLEEQLKNAQDDNTVTGSKIDIARTNISKAEAQVKYRQARIEEQKVKLAYCRIIAPIKGRIGRKNIETGQYVQPGQNLMTIVNDSSFWLVANFKETQLDRLRSGQKAEIKLDAYPEKILEGELDDFSSATGSKFALLPADNATGNFVKVTQRIPVKIKIKDAEKYKDILRAGLSAEVKVRVK